ncbi:uncharacterized protein BCR38DRAFT_509320 [Pseudomassariella vexata]|uniref:Uncharacterized protein n=1 Tax=Pseudomassariella vexata TaxID=1141098 RepID=A0A1Y2E831_9PEZI|nr:uncharacterized protein BCR38DRAFT_509320 [Pseudomassariella vexata]ORY67005.1 hypothetical protein BCR38DRAFT_509320 [Pseudomassariella vexata]
MDILVENAGYYCRVKAYKTSHQARSSHQTKNKTSLFGLRINLQLPRPPIRDACRDSWHALLEIWHHRQRQQYRRPRRSPESGFYTTRKFALEGLSQSMAREVAKFGFSVLIVESAASRANFLGPLVHKERVCVRC